MLGLVLEPILESKLRLALTLSGGDLAVFVERPITASLLAIALLIFFGPVVLRGWRWAGLGRASGRQSKG